MDHNNLLAQTAHSYTITNPNNPSATSDPTGTMENYISLGITFLSVVAIIFFAVQIILAGYAFMNSKGDAKNMEIARNRLTQSVLGLTLIIVATAIAALIASIFGISNAFSLTHFFTRVGL